MIAEYWLLFHSFKTKNILSRYHYDLGTSGTDMLLRGGMLINRGRKVRGKESGFLYAASQPDTHTCTYTTHNTQSDMNALFDSSIGAQIFVASHGGPLFHPQVVGGHWHRGKSEKRTVLWLKPRQWQSKFLPRAISKTLCVSASKSLTGSSQHAP